MEDALTRRLQKLHLLEYPSVTRGTQNDCLFAAAVDRIRGYAFNDRKATGMETEAGGFVYAKAKSADGTVSRHQISDMQGLRHYIALSGMQIATSVNEKRGRLVSHMKHRFPGGLLRPEDTQLVGVAPLAQNPSDIQMIVKWCEVIVAGGVFR